MYLYFHTNTEMALHYIKDLLRDDAEHPVSEIYDYVMENCKGQAIMGQPMTATVISSATLASGSYRGERLLSDTPRDLPERRSGEGDEGKTYPLCKERSVS